MIFMNNKSGGFTLLVSRCGVKLHNWDCGNETKANRSMEQKVAQGGTYR